MFDPFEHLVGWSWTPLDGLDLLLRQHPTLYSTSWIHFIIFFNDVERAWSSPTISNIVSNMLDPFEHFFIEVERACSSPPTTSNIVRNMLDPFEHFFIEVERACSSPPTTSNIVRNMLDPFEHFFNEVERAWSSPTTSNIVRNMLDPFEHFSMKLNELNLLLRQHPTSLHATCLIRLNTLFRWSWTTLDGVDLFQQHLSLYSTCWISSV